MTGSGGKFLSKPTVWTALGMAMFLLACQTNDPSQTNEHSHVNDDVESARFAATICSTDEECQPVPACREPRCVNGDCRFLQLDPTCCTQDEECDPGNTCLNGSCNLEAGAETGTCSTETDPDKEGCCHTIADCPQPPDGGLATCEDIDGMDYKVCSVVLDPGACMPPLQGIVINEFMAYAMAVSDLTGEWIELTNTGLEPIDLQGWTFRDVDSDEFTLNSASPLILEPGGYFVVARSDNPQNNGGINPDYTYYNMILSNGADEIILYDSQGTEVDRVEYGGDDFVTQEGSSFELLNPYLDNNDPLNWVHAINSTPPALDKGTPGAPNTDAFFVYYTPPVCNDGNSCTLDMCGNNGEPLCVHHPINDCCLYDVDCDDGDVCTADACDAATLTCTHNHIDGCCTTAAECNDSSICTVDQCVNQKCRHSPDHTRPLCCTADNQCKDVNPCTVDYCSQDPDKPYKTCHHVSPGGVECCNLDVECDDDMPSTIDSCVNHNCVHEQDPEYCTAPPPLFCNDQNPCTIDSCNMDTLLCEHEPIDGCCIENSQCDDGDVCTMDICQSAVHTCTHVWEAWCCHEEFDCYPYMTDQDLCKEPVCINNECRLLPAPTVDCCLTDVDCEDGDPCTEDTCNPGNHTCNHTPKGVGCCIVDSQCQEDEDPCTEVACVDNQCTYLPILNCCKGDWECEDATPCTMDFCINYRCRYVTDGADGCCMTVQDCPAPSSDCVTVACTSNHACAYEIQDECTVTPDWLETFSGSYTLEERGWTTPTTGIGTFATHNGESGLGSDACVVMEADPAVQGGTLCLRSPVISVQDPDETVTVTFEQSASADLSQTSGQLVLKVTGRPVGLMDSVTLGHFTPNSITTNQPMMIALPYKLKSSPFSLAFCAEIPQGAINPKWGIDTIRVGRGSPPRIQTLHNNIVRLPEEEPIQPLTVTDSDGDSLSLHLAGPQHAQLQQTGLEEGWFEGGLRFQAVSASTVGEFTTVFEISDGFFEDRRTVRETIYIPKCTSQEECNDQNDCTQDNCDPMLGCTNEPIEGCCNELTACNDNNLCTTDQCVDGTCVYTPVDCNDDDICTDDLCNPSTGCTHPFNTASCDDNNICTWHDTCFQGTCTGSQVDCSDDLDCTLDTCDPIDGCQHKSLCTDSILCTTDICTYEGCRYGKLPVGTSEVDGADGEAEWPETSVLGSGSTVLGEFRMMVEETNLYIAVDANAGAGSGLVIALDTDFPHSTGIQMFSNVLPGSLPLDDVLTSSLEVAFPGFGADVVLAAKWGSNPTQGPEEMNCFAVSAFEEPSIVPCNFVASPYGLLEIALPWTSFYPDTQFQGKVSAAVAAMITASGQVIEAVPSNQDNVVSDIEVFGVQDPMCLTAFCGDGFLDAGEECDWGNENDNELPDTCRLDCRLPWCGDDVIDTDELCDDGENNSNVQPDACRLDCTPPTCGDGVTDEEEECDNGDDNQDGVPDVCHNNCLLPFCGDGIQDSNEQCDNGQDNSNTEADACRLDCQTAWCGDGITDTPEECDDGEDNADNTPDACSMTCIAPFCGDNIIDAQHGEQCDNGDANSDSAPNACRKNCLEAHCGDGIIDDDEECDDGNQTNWDGCNNDCTIYVAVCGDGVHTPNEECDNGEDNSNTQPDACRLDCTLPSCGDGVTDSGELCDDGNTLPGDTCDSDCTPYVPACGNGWLDPGEECDAGDLNSDTQPDACRNDCTLHECGDGVTDSDEQCDDGAFNNDTVPNSCRTSCVLPYCGDDVVDDGEECDDGGNNADLPNHCKPDCVAPTCGDDVVDDLLGEECDWGELNNDFEPDFCRENCLNPHCGDGLPDSDEECDDGDDNSDTAPDACRMDCTEPFCGDGVADSDEECDNGDDNSNTTPDVCRMDCTEPICGDDIIDPAYNEECDNGNLNNDDLPNMCRTNCLEAHCGDSVVDSGEECDDGNTQPDDGCDENCIEEVYLPFPGDVIITEIMQNPALTLDAYGEYFEVYSTADIPIDLNGWDIDSNGETHEIVNDGPLWIYPGEFLVLGNNKDPLSNGGVSVDYEYSDILLLNNIDIVEISFRGYISDSVTYDGGTTFPDPSGASMELDPSHYDYQDNDNGANWCESTTLLSSGDFGSPGQSNSTCQ